MGRAYPGFNFSNTNPGCTQQLLLSPLVLLTNNAVTLWANWSVTETTGNEVERSRTKLPVLRPGMVSVVTSVTTSVPNRQLVIKLRRCQPISMMSMWCQWWIFMKYHTIIYYHHKNIVFRIRREWSQRHAAPQNPLVLLPLCGIPSAWDHFQGFCGARPLHPKCLSNGKQQPPWWCNFSIGQQTGESYWPLYLLVATAW